MFNFEKNKNEILLYRCKEGNVHNAQNQESKVQTQESKVQNQESKVQNQESKVQNQAYLLASFLFRLVATKLGFVR